MIKKLLLMFALIIPTTAFALNHQQEQSIRVATSLGAMLNVPLLPAMVMAESSGCNKPIGDDGKSFGCLQVGVLAARDVLSACKHIEACNWLEFNGTNEQLKRRLQTDKEFNMYIGAFYFKMQLKRFGGNVDRALVAYNAGYKTAKTIKNPQQHRYVKAIKLWSGVSSARHFKTVKYTNNYNVQNVMIH